MTGTPHYFRLTGHYTNDLSTILLLSIRTQNPELGMTLYLVLVQTVAPVSFHKFVSVEAHLLTDCQHTYEHQSL